MFVKLVFLVRQETELGKDQAFYDFVPYRYGPFSFALYRELANLRRDGYVAPQEDCVAIRADMRHLVAERARELPATKRRAVAAILRGYGEVHQRSLMEDVYRRYPWYASASELADLRPAGAADIRRPAVPAVYTTGYEGKSVDAFFDQLLRQGIEGIIDVRANPVSRKYGFCRSHLSEISNKLGMRYAHAPELGIPSVYRAELGDDSSYARLLERYERDILPSVQDHITGVARSMEAQPSVLLCVERDVRHCHRSRLAYAVSGACGLEVVHL